MIVNSPRIFSGDKEKFIPLKSKISKRKKNGESNRFLSSPLRILSMVIVISAFLLGGSYIINNRLFKEKFLINRIIIEGNEFISDDVILSASGARKGADLFKFDIYAAKLAIEKIPQIYSANLRRKLPDTIIIQIAERKARAIINIGGDKIPPICVDSEGVILPFEASGGQDDMTVINGINISRLKLGTICGDNNLKIALTILRLHDISILKEKVNVEKISIDKSGDIHIDEREKNPRRRLYKVHLGKDGFEQKLANLAEILKVELARQDSLDRKIDLTFERPLSIPIGKEGGS